MKYGITQLLTNRVKKKFPIWPKIKSYLLKCLGWHTMPNITHSCSKCPQSNSLLLAFTTTSGGRTPSPPQPPGPPLLCVCCPYYFWRDEPKPYQSLFWEKTQPRLFSFPRAEVILMANYRHHFFCQCWPPVTYLRLFLLLSSRSRWDHSSPHQSSNSVLQTVCLKSLPGAQHWTTLVPRVWD